MKRNQIPVMTCKEGCHKCCGVVPFSSAEKKAVETMDLAIRIEWMDIDIAFVPRKTGDREIDVNNPPDCPFLGQDGCQIYEKRPLMCRLFGVVDTPVLICPENQKPPKMLTDNESSILLKKLRKQERRDR